MIAYCGLTCSECPAYLATQANTVEKLKDIALSWSTKYATKLRPDDVWCDGCPADGRKFSHCDDCRIRRCARDRALVTCAACDEYACETLTELFELVPQAKVTLDALR